MENITRDFIQKFLSENEVGLCCTQARLCIPIIARIYRKMCFGIQFSEIKVADHMICDGHHRYVASLLAKLPIDFVPYKITGATDVIAWNSVVFVEDDWDTQAKIEW